MLAGSKRRDLAALAGITNSFGDVIVTSISMASPHNTHGHLRISLDVSSRAIDGDDKGIFGYIIFANTMTSSLGLCAVWAC